MTAFLFEDRRSKAPRRIVNHNVLYGARKWATWQVKRASWTAYHRVEPQHTDERNQRDCV